MERQRKRRSALLRDLEQHSESLRATLELLDEPAVAASERVPWADVKKLAEQVSKEATTSGMLWCGTPTEQEASEKLQSYVNQLQGFILLCHGATVGAGPTLLSLVQKNCKLVVESSLTLLQNALSHESQASRQESLPPLTGCVWEACELIKKQAFDNRTAIGRAIVLAGASMKDVLRELSEINPTAEEDDDDGDGDDDDDEAPVKFSTSDMEIVEACKRVIEGVVELARQVLHIVSKTQEDPAKVSGLEKLLKLFQGLGRDVDELGASVFMQEVEKLGEFSGGLEQGVKLVLSEVSSLIGSLPESLASTCERVHEFHCGLEDRLTGLEASEALGDLKLS